ncbi:MAG TPA: LysE family translocator [Spirochaetota bacterium]|nr:LysE family translocator [Spirochaetota bacterium]HPJ34265.1 LysE family translocator [Spirochaetota bacterium]
MPDINSLIMFLTASTLLAFAPGPDNIFVLSQSIAYGRSAGYKITLGLCTGLLVHTSVVAFGIAAIFQTSLMAFNILKYAGVVYLLYLAYLTFRHSGDKVEIQAGNNGRKINLYRRGIIMNVTNPKVSIFFMAFLPQFASPENGSITFQIIILGFLFIVVTVLVFGLISFLAGSIGGILAGSSKFEKWLNLFAGTVLASLAVKLALTER